MANHRAQETSKPMDQRTFNPLKPGNLGFPVFNEFGLPGFCKRHDAFETKSASSLIDLGIKVAEATWNPCCRDFLATKDAGAP
jgi:hypothetical protein